MTGNKLKTILQGIDWQKNIDDALSYKDTECAIEEASRRVAIWSRQLEILDSDNPALSFVREMQVAIQNSGLLIGMCLYKASAAFSRTMVETCLYYSYFRSHPTELSTLVTNPKYFVSKSEILDYHKIHTVDFASRQSALGLVSKLDSWYSRASAVVHGQIPGAWTTHSALADISFKEDTHNLALATLVEAELIVHQILLCTIGHIMWRGIAPDAKTYLLKGLPGKAKTALGLDAK